MPWSRISFAGGYDSPDCLWLRTVFQALYEHVTEDEYDALVLYRAKRPDAEATLYLSPRATSRLRAAVSRFDLRDCERPAAEDVEVAIGVAIAWDPAFCEHSAAERAAIRDDAVWAWLEDAGYYEHPERFTEEDFVDLNGPQFRTTTPVQ